MKTCSKCKVVQPISNFNKQGSGYQSHCRGCRKVYFARHGKAYYEKNKLKRQASSLARYRADPEAARGRWLMKYWPGLTGKEAAACYRALEVLQNYVCALCLRPERSLDHRTGNPKRLSVDHHHGTGAVRGLLCSECNPALGKLKLDECPDNLKRLCIYLGNND